LPLPDGPEMMGNAVYGLRHNYETDEEAENGGERKCGACASLHQPELSRFLRTLRPSPNVDVRQTRAQCISHGYRIVAGVHLQEQNAYLIIIETEILARACD
jgi:hypothetical protein